jgi:HPt (histidine-containing phosphotransfer) domain-containing protein
MDAPGQNNLNEALDRLWAQYLPLVKERIAILEAAAAASATHQLSAEQVEAAKSAAHKLAGVLGSYGLPRGTQVARELETMYSCLKDPGALLSAHLASLAAELRQIVETRK